MKKVIKLTESDITEIVKKILIEQKYASGQKYPSCAAGTYKKGCFSEKVKKVQDCLGVSPSSGNFGPKTQRALKNKFPNNKFYLGFTDADISTICSGKPNNTEIKNVFVSDTINPDYLNGLKFSKLKTNGRSSNIVDPGTDQCAQFINFFSDKFDYVGDAWMAYINGSLGNTIYSKFKGLNSTQIKTAIDLWLKLHKKGGGQENGSDMSNVRNFIGSLVPKGANVKLELDDIVGIYNPDSSHHEESFYQGGQSWFTEKNGKMVPGNTIKKGDAWGMNTHIGIVGAIKDGVPLIFHNVKGTVLSDHPSNLRIAWVKRKGGTNPINPFVNKRKKFLGLFE